MIDLRQGDCLELMKKAPKVLTRMRLSCCWGDNLDEKELNDVVDYINELEHQCKKQKEVIDKIKEICASVPEDWTICGVEKIYEIEETLKEVSNNE